MLGPAIALAQDIQAWITGAGGKPALAVIDFRGAGHAAFHGGVQLDII